MTLLHSSSPSIVEQENKDTEFEATIQDDTGAITPDAVIDELHNSRHEDGTEADVSLSDVMQQHQQVILNIKLSHN